MPAERMWAVYWPDGWLWGTPKRTRHEAIEACREFWDWRTWRTLRRHHGFTVARVVVLPLAEYEALRSSQAGPMTDKPAESAVERYFWCEDGFICDRNAPVDGTLEDQDPMWWGVDDPCRVLNEQDAALAELKAENEALRRELEERTREAERWKLCAELAIAGPGELTDEDMDWAREVLSRKDAAHDPGGEE